jgi:hypothetical protein
MVDRPRYKPTEHDACYKAAMDAIPGYATLPDETRKALLNFIRARTYVYAADKASQPHELIASVTMDAELKFLDRIDSDLIRATCKELVPRLTDTMR